MISQSFLDQLEVGLKKSYNRTLRSIQLNSEDNARETFTSLREARERNVFQTKFMETFREHNPILEQEIRKGGHRNTGQILTLLNRQVETQLSLLLFRSSFIDEKTFTSWVRQMKLDVRSLFYSNYLGGK